MRLRQRISQTFYYRLYTGQIEEIDDYGNATGQYTRTYAAPVECKGNISPPSGEDIVELFGAIEHYDKIIQTCDMDCPIDENSVLYVDTVPVLGADGVWSAHDYYVKRVAKSVNTIRIGVSKVNVSNDGQGVISG